LGWAGPGWFRNPNSQFGGLDGRVEQREGLYFVD
jgi:hypothetical protein